MSTYVLRKTEITVISDGPIPIVGAAPMDVYKVAVLNQKVFIWSWQQDRTDAKSITRHIILVEEDKPIDLSSLQDQGGNAPGLRPVGMVNLNGLKYSICFQLDYMPGDD